MDETQHKRPVGRVEKAARGVGCAYLALLLFTVAVSAFTRAWGDMFDAAGVAAIVWLGMRLYRGREDARWERDQARGPLWGARLAPSSPVALDRGDTTAQGVAR